MVWVINGYFNEMLKNEGQILPLNVILSVPLILVVFVLLCFTLTFLPRASYSRSSKTSVVFMVTSASVVQGSCNMTRGRE